MITLLVSLMPMKILGMELEVLLDEGRHVEKAVVVSRSYLVGMFVVCRDQFVHQVSKKHLPGELVGTADIDQHRNMSVFATSNNFSGVIGRSFRLWVLKEASIRLDSPIL